MDTTTAVIQLFLLILGLALLIALVPILLFRKWPWLAYDTTERVLDAILGREYKQFESYAGRADLIGQLATIRRPFSATSSGAKGKVSLHGEVWNAVSLFDPECFEVGKPCTIVSITGLTLRVEPADGTGAA